MQNKDLMYGLVLGDGHLTSLNKSHPNSVLSIGHAPKQLEYLEWKSQRLQEMGFTAKINSYKGIKKNGDNYHMYQLRTNASRFLTELRAEMYEFRRTEEKYKKRITKKLLEKCSLTTLLLWYLDDGHNDRTHNRIWLCTYDFSYEEQEIIRSWIYDLTGAEMNINGRKGNWYLSTYKNANIIRETLQSINPNVDCMQYKFIRDLEHHDLHNQKRNEKRRKNPALISQI